MDKKGTEAEAMGGQGAELRMIHGFNTGRIRHTSPVYGRCVQCRKEVGAFQEAFQCECDETGLWDVVLPSERIDAVGSALVRLHLHPQFHTGVYGGEKVACQCYASELYCTIRCSDPKDVISEVYDAMEAHFNYETWYYGMKGVHVVDGAGRHYDPMPAAHFIPLERHHIEALAAACVGRVARNGRACDSEEEEGLDNVVTAINLGIEDACEHLSITNLRKNDAVVGDCGSADALFIRTSEMSPKDVMIHMVEGCISGKEIVQRFISSARMERSFTHFLRSRDTARSCSVVVQRWDLSMDLGLEFRCFIHNGVLTAITQYDCYSSRLLLQDVPSLFFIRSLIGDFYQQMKHRVPYSSCVMDVVLKPADPGYLGQMNAQFDPPSMRLSSLVGLAAELGTDTAVSDSVPGPGALWRLHVVEFNPYYADVATGAGLFEWERDFDALHCFEPGVERNVVMRVRVAEKSIKFHEREHKALVLELR